jgi:hypothetical protein
MTVKPALESPVEPNVTIDEVNRVLDVGHILLTALTTKEMDQVMKLLSNQSINSLLTAQLSSVPEIGNTGVT